VALLFVLLSAVHGAVTLFDERDTGIIDRVVTGPAGVRPLVDGKFLFLAAVGTVQASVIFGVAWLVHGLNLLPNLLGWALTTILASLSAAGLALALTTHFRTRQQAATFANVAMLILSALGGSMIPRFLMPQWLQAAGWVTPNAWALEAYTALFWRDEPLGSLVLPLALMALSAVLGLLVARRGARALERL
jgi:ABC-2 type transport system permease protein